jgi:hypothetical protein
MKGIVDFQLPIADLKKASHWRCLSIGNWQSKIGNEMNRYVDAEES